MLYRRVAARAPRADFHRAGLAYEELEERRVLSVSAELLADLGMGDDSAPAHMLAVDSAVYFIASNGSGYHQLWKYDGSDSTAVLLTEFAKRISSSWSPVLMEFDGRVFLAEQDGSQAELWATDGTPEGTLPLAEIGSGLIEGYAVLDATLYFAVRGNNVGALWKSDGTATGTQKIADFESIYAPVTLGNHLYFSANDGSSGSELWRSDGTAAGTSLVHEIWAGPVGSGAAELTVVHGVLYFVAQDSTSRSELWRTDGTAEGTQLVADINPGLNQSSSPRYLMNVNGTLYFTADDGTHGRELWKFDPTTATASLVQDIRLGGFSSDPIGLEQLGDQILFVADDGVHGKELWHSNGTPGGTSLLVDVDPGSSSGLDYNTSASSLPLLAPELVRVNSEVYFRASDGIHGFELWKTDGTAAGTHRVADILPGGRSSSPANLALAGEALYFSARDARGNELWKTDGTEQGTVLAVDINTQATRDSDPAQFTSAGAVTYFVASTPESGGELWRTDGTQAGTYLVKDVLANDLDNHLGNLTMVGNTLFFTAHGGRQLWKSDGTTAGTVFIAFINQAAYSQGPDAPIDTPLVALNDATVLFLSTDAAHGRELWKSDGTSAGTMLVKDINPTGSAFDPWSPLPGIVNNGELYFTAPNGTANALWKTDGTTTGTVVVKEGMSASLGASIDGILYFGAYTVDYGAGLYRTDGTTEGTTLVRGFPAELSGKTANVTVVGGEIYFTVYTKDLNGYQRLWRTDGSSEGTADLWTSSTRSFSTNWNAFITPYQGYLYFLETGNQLRAWRTEISSPSVELFKVLDTGTGAVSIVGMTQTTDKLYIALRSDGLWVSDGSPEGTVPVKDQGGNPIGPSFGYEFANSGGLLLFSNWDTAHGEEPWIVAPPVVARLFYNNSAFDGKSPAAGAEDDGALAIDKIPYFAGAGPATNQNVSTYSRGINGLFVDLAGQHGALSVDDFVFRVGNNNAPESWVDAPAPISITVRAGAGVAGGDRVELIWADGAIKNTWLQVTVRGNDLAGGFNDNSGLEKSEIFYWGSKVADSGTDTGSGSFETTIAGAAQVFAKLGSNKPVSDLHDFNRDGQVSTTDSLIVFANLGSIVRLDVPVGGPFAPEAAPSVEIASRGENGPADGMRAALASALAMRSFAGDSSTWDVSAARLVTDGEPPTAVRPRAVAPNEGARSQALLELVAAADEEAEPEETGITDELVEELLARVVG